MGSLGGNTRLPGVRWRLLLKLALPSDTQTLIKKLSKCWGKAHHTLWLLLLRFNCLWLHDRFLKASFSSGSPYPPFSLLGKGASLPGLCFHSWHCTEQLHHAVQSEKPGSQQIILHGTTKASAWELGNTSNPPKQVWRSQDGAWKRENTRGEWQKESF